jgi:Zn-dependent protease
MDGNTPPVQVLIWMIAVVVSIVIHELGHALVQRHYGGRPRIVLYGMGGLAICEDCDRSTRSQILIALAGPCAGFLFALAIVVLLRITGHGIALIVGDEVRFTTGSISRPLPFLLFHAGIAFERFASPNSNLAVLNLLYINVLWGLVNLIPFYPLDGGQISREVCQIGNPRGGIIQSLRISVVAAVAMAVFGLVAWQSFYTALMFGYLAYASYRTLEAYRQSLW